MAEFTEVMKQKNRIHEFFMNKGHCMDCPISYYNNGCCAACTTLLVDYPQEAEEIIMNWAKENPIITNKDKFKEIFGVDIDETNCCLKVECKYSNCGECEWDNFWYREYAEPSEV